MYAYFAVSCAQAYLHIHNFWPVRRRPPPTAAALGRKVASLNKKSGFGGLTVLNCCELFQTVPNSSKLLQSVSNCFGLLRTVSDVPWKSARPARPCPPAASNSFKLLQAVSSCFDRLQTVSDCFELLRTVPSRFKLFQAVPEARLTFGTAVGFADGLPQAP